MVHLKILQHQTLETYLEEINMNRTLKRPMFRIGGSAGTGITSGLDKPRKQYKEGTMPAGMFQATGLPGFLTSFGLNLLSTPPRGGFFSTVAQAAQQPTQQLFQGLDEERGLQRQVSLAAEQSDIAQEQAIALQLLKNDEVSALPYQRKIQYLMDKLNIPEEDAIRFVETSKTDYTKLTDEAKIQKELDDMVTKDYTIAEFRALVLPGLPADKRPRATDKIRSRDGKFPKRPAVGVVYPDADTGKLFEYNGGEPNDINSYTDVTGQYM